MIISFLRGKKAIQTYQALCEKVITSIHVVRVHDLTIVYAYMIV